jgi:hypothetical protein
MPTTIEPTSSPAVPASEILQDTPVDHLAAAIIQLNRSERGRRALVAFRRFLDANDGSALGLDFDNQRAIETIARACRIFGAYKIRNVLPTR